MADPQPKSGGTLFFAVESDPSNYDCQANVSFAFLESVAPHYSTLLKFDTANYPQVTGDLAESWSVSPDKLTYTFKLRPNVLFHDGVPMTSADVKASYQRILRPPPGVISARQSDYASIGTIETPDPLTIVYHLQRPDAAMLAKFASPWNCIYQGAKLDADPQFPRTHILGTGPFAFVEHKKGEHWIGRRWDHYFQPGKPYLDGYEADVMSGSSTVKALETGQVMAGFRSFTPAERDELEARVGDRINVRESPWLLNQMLVFNAKQPPFDDARVRRALSLAIDRWDMADTLSHTTVMKFVGGLMRPGFAMATPDATLATLPGFSHDIAASRKEARRLLAEARVHDLKITLVNRDLPSAYGSNADAIIDAWRAVGVTANEVKLNARDWQKALESGHFAAAIDFGGDAFDDPTLQLAKYVSFSLFNYTHSIDQTLDSLYAAQAASTELQQRARIVHDFEQRALTEAYSVPILWWNRIVITSANVEGWNMTPSHYIGQDLADVWIDRRVLGTNAPPETVAPGSQTAHVVPSTPASPTVRVAPAPVAPALVTTPASTKTAAPVTPTAPVAPSPPTPAEAAARNVPATPPALPANAAMADTSSSSPLEPTLSPADLVAALMHRGDEMLAVGDIATARLLYERVATSGSAPAATAVGGTYDPEVLALLGVQGIQPDPAMAITWYRRAADLGDAEATARLKRLEDMSAPMKSAVSVKPAASAPPATSALAIADTRSSSRAATEPASSPDDMIAALMHRGDEMLAVGDIATARLLYERVAASGSAPAATAVGGTYDPEVLALLGVQGIQPDPAMAITWYHRAADLGDAEATARLKRLEDISAPTKTAVSVKPAASAPPATSALAIADTRSSSRAATEPASSPDDMIATLMHRGDEMLAVGDIATARLLYERVAASGSAPAATAVGGTYDPEVLVLLGVRGIQPDPAMAVTWYRRAADLGDAEATARLKRLGAGGTTQ